MTEQVPDEADGLLSQVGPARLTTVAESDERPRGDRQAIFGEFGLASETRAATRSRVDPAPSTGSASHSVARRPPGHGCCPVTVRMILPWAR